MKILYVEVPYASFRKSFARSYAETYPLPPPATVYGMLLSLVGERFRRRHEGVRLAFAYRQLPRLATTLRKLSRYKYGVPGKQSKLGNAPDFIETLCDIEFLCWIDSSQEKHSADAPTLEERVLEALSQPSRVDRFGLLCLGLSDDAVNDLRLEEAVEGEWHRLLPNPAGNLELPIWVDHVGSLKTRWQRYRWEPQATGITEVPGGSSWQWTEMIGPD